MNEEIKAATVDSPEFRELLEHLLNPERSTAFTTAALIAHIDARIAQARQEAYENAAQECDRIGSRYSTQFAVADCAEAIRALATEPASRAMLPVTDEMIRDLTDIAYRLRSGGELIAGSVMAQGLAANIDRIILALASPVVGWVPEGWQLVPIEPTPKMMQEGEYAASMEYALRKSFYWVGKNAYRKMLEAAPPAPVTPKQEQS